MIAVIFFCLLLLSAPCWLFTFEEPYTEYVLASPASYNFDGFSTYNNREYGFEIQYPSDWQKIEFSQGVERGGRNIVINFVSLSEASSDKFRAYMIVEVANLQPQQLLTGYVNQQISDYKKMFHGFKLIESTPSSSSNSVNGSDGIHNSVSPYSKVVFKYDDSMAEEIKIMELYFLNKNRIYILSFHSEATGYGNYLPTIQEMVDSFHIT